MATQAGLLPAPPPQIGSQSSLVIDGPAGETHAPQCIDARLTFAEVLRDILKPDPRVTLGGLPDVRRPPTPCRVGSERQGPGPDLPEHLI